MEYATSNITCLFIAIVIIGIIIVALSNKGEKK